MQGLQRAAGWVSILAGLIHLGAGPSHLEEWWVYGIFFFGAAATQAMYGIIVLTEGIEGWGGWAAVRGRFYKLGIAMTLAIVALWVLSRTVGVPIGPEAFEPEPIGWLDAASKVVEATLLVLLFRLVRQERSAPVAT